MPYTDAQIKKALLGSARRWSFRHEIIDRDGNLKGIANVIDAAVSNNDLADRVKRTCDFKLAADNNIDFYKDKIRSFAKLKMGEKTEQVQYANPTAVVTSETKNLITNPSFEDGTVGGWSNNGATTIANSAVQAYVGTRSLSVTLPASGNGLGALHNGIGLVAGQVYTASAYVRSSVALPMQLATNGAVGSVVNIPANAWTRLTLTFTSVVNDVLYVVKNGAAASEVFFIDAVQIETGTAVSIYFDGTLRDSFNYTYGWTGTAHASISIRRNVDRSKAKPYSDVVLSKSPVGWWRLGESTGTVAADSSGNGRNGTYVGSPTLGVSGAVVTDSDKAVRFHDAAAHARVPIQIGGSGSVSLWVNVDQWAADAVAHGVFQSGDHSVVNYAGWLALFRWTGATSAGAQFYFRIVNDAGTAMDLAAPWGDWFPPSGWAHVVATWGAGRMDLYVNGVAKAGRADLGAYSGDQSVNNPTFSRVGFAHQNGGQGTPIDESAVYSTALTAAEIKENYDAGLGRIPTYRTETVVTPEWQEWCVGTFHLTTSGKKWNVKKGGVSKVDSYNVEAYDSLIVLHEDAVLDRYVVTAGTNYRTAVTTVLSSSGFNTHQIASTTLTLPADKEWGPGTTKLKIINDLLSAINYHSLVMDPLGVPTASPYLAPENATPLWEYRVDRESVIIPGVDVELDLFNIPNAWVATVSEPDRPVLTASKINSDPNSLLSTVSRGRTIVQIVQPDRGDTNGDGVIEAATLAVLQEKLERIAKESTQQFEIADFETGLMPFHGSGDVCIINYGQGDLRFREHEWKIELKAGGKMSHKFRRVVSI